MKYFLKHGGSVRISHSLLYYLVTLSVLISCKFWNYTKSITENVYLIIGPVNSYILVFLVK